MAKVIEKWRELSHKMGNFALGISGTFEGKQTSEFLSESTVASRKKWARLLYNFCFALTLALIVTGVRQGEIPVLYSSLGEVAEENIHSPVTADIEPSESNPQQKESLAHRVPPIFDYDDKVLIKWLERWKLTFRTIRTEFYATPRKNSRNPALLEQLSKRVSELSKQTLRPRDLLYLHENKFSIPSEKTFIKLSEFLTGRIIASSDLFPSHYSTGIIVRQLNEGLHESLVQDVSRIWSLDQAREVLNHVPTMLKDTSLYNPRVMVEIINSLLVPNLTYNEGLSQKRVAAFLSTAKLPIVHVRKGQLIIRKGDRLTEQHLELLQSLRDLTSPMANAKRLALSFIILYVFLNILFRVNMGRKGFDKLTLKDALFFLILSAGTVICCKLGSQYLQIILANFNLSRVSDYLIPISTGGIILHLMMGRSASYTYALLVSTVVGFMLEQNFLYMLWAFTLTCAAIQSIGTCRTRTDLFKCGAWSGGVGSILLLSFSLIQYLGYKQTDWTNVLAATAFAFVSGMAATVITSMFIPFLESAFGYTTSLKLLELSNFHHPLLHTLMMKAPGTYHHSVIVGSLAEIAADRVNANGLLARVSAYYHDIGKMTKPLYFIENQTPGNNPHDHLQPSMSAKILFSHVKNGVRMGKEYNLGAKVIDIIEQHHGTTLASYFYNKAKEHDHGSMGHAEESHFRYPGPKPQTREAGIVMLADACEAATRSIAEPTPAKIQTMVHHIITKRFLEEQFSECELTFQDLQIIEHHFTRTLVSLYHHRIEYPGQKSTLDPGNHPQNAKTAKAPHPEGHGKKSVG